MVMPFGKYAGVDVCDLPSDYLSWLSSIDLRGGRLRNEVMEECAARGIRSNDNHDHEGAPRPEPERNFGIKLQPEEISLMRRVIDAGYRSVSKQLHPDHGGDARQMRELNALRDNVRTQLELLELGV